MEMNTKNILTIGAIALTALTLVGAFYFSFIRVAAPGTGSAATTTATSTGTLGDGLSASGGVVINETPANPAPDFTKPVAFSSSIGADVRGALNTQLASVQAALRKNPSDFGAWLHLATIYHVGGDERAAEKIWLYTAAAAPTAPESFINLGELYLDYLKDNAKAEINLKKAVALNPHDTSSYRNLFSLYTDFGYKTQNAEPLLKEAIANNPTDAGLQVLLARYYKSHGRTAEAKAEYDTAIATATAAGNTQLAADLTAEKSSF